MAVVSNTSIIYLLNSLAGDRASSKEDFFFSQNVYLGLQCYIIIHEKYFLISFLFQRTHLTDTSPADSLPSFKAQLLRGLQ